MTTSAPEVTHAPFCSPLAEALAEDVLARFLRYVRIDTQSVEGSESYPSTAKQLDLSRLLVDELLALGLADAHLDEHGYVLATVPATAPAIATHALPAPGALGTLPAPGAPGAVQPSANGAAADGAAAPDLGVSGNDAASSQISVGWIAHVDTSPEASGASVKPQIVRAYDGRDLQLPGDPSQVLRPSENPALAAHLGHDLITTDGTTLLGADDKAGVAEIMGAVAYLIRHPEIPHGPLRIAFTPDEEIGEGTRYFDITAFGADVAYTVDGSTLGEIEDETFSASSLTVTIRGHNIHPGYAKGQMVNSIKLAARLLSRLPQDALSPESTEGRQGYVHPMAIEGGVGETTIRFIVRDFETTKLEEYETILRGLAAQIAVEEPRARVTVDVKRSYRNMKDYLKDFPRVLEAAEVAVQRAGLSPVRAFIRGGTDGARLSERGLPTPNLFDGAHDYHSVREWVSVQDMAAAAATLVHLAQVWAE